MTLFNTDFGQVKETQCSIGDLQFFLIKNNPVDTRLQGYYSSQAGTCVIKKRQWYNQKNQYRSTTTIGYYYQGKKYTLTQEGYLPKHDLRILCNKLMRTVNAGIAEPEMIKH